MYEVGALQVEDLVSLGRVILELATLNMTSVKRDWPSALGYVTANYSPDLKNFLQSDLSFAFTDFLDSFYRRDRPMKIKEEYLY